MDKAPTPETPNPKLALKKETLQHLKVRTDLKGGVAVAAFPCTHIITHHCAAPQFGAAVINPAAR
jgi:hypothetical protein